jgi:CHAT domain-containing protein
MSMNRSGLLMAGAGNSISGLPKSGIDDGILTSKEISSLDFTHLDLAVLSACETALGEIGSEGVFGLQRAFKKAGTHTLLMSLRKVDDNATKILMTSFYGNLSTMDKLTAFRTAQRKLRQAEGGKYDHPHYWASFILLDD